MAIGFNRRRDGVNIQIMKRNQQQGAVGLGILILVSGIVLLLNRMSGTDIDLWGWWMRWWPLAVIIIGLSMMTSGNRVAGWIVGILAAGGLLAGWSLGWFEPENRIGNEVQNFEVEDFDSVEIRGAGRVMIKEAESGRVEIRGEGRPWQAEVVNGRLIVEPKGEWWRWIPRRTVVISIEGPEINQITANGALEVETEKLAGEKIRIISNGAASIRADIEAEKLETEINGAGKMEVWGTTVEQRVNISGVGEYSAKDLISQEAEVVISGAGKGVVRVENELTARISGAGSVEYYGDPRVKEQISGAGNVERRED